MTDTKETKLQKTQPARRGALGKGINSLLGLSEEPELGLPTRQTKEEPATRKVVDFTEIDIRALEPNPHQPRKVFRDAELKSLAESVKEDGVIQPLLVSKSTKPGHYILIAGERRWRAAQMAGMEKIPVVIKERTPEEMLRVALIENIQRSDLNIIEEALAYGSLINDFGLTQEQCAQKVGKDRSTVANALRLLTLPREIQDNLMKKKITMGHGRAFLSLQDKKLMLRAMDQVLKKELSVRQTETLCKTILKNNGEIKKQKEDLSPNLLYMAEGLRSKLKTKVNLKGNSKRGKIEISYFSASELERLVTLMGINNQ